MSVLENDPGVRLGVPDAQLKNYSANASLHVPGIQNSEVISKYSEWSANYEQDLNPEIYRGPQIAADFCNILVFNKDARILDVGAGTGFVGSYLNKHGFRNIDALEPSSGMMDLAKAKKVYANYFLEKISANEKTTINENTYDVVLLAGAMGEGHIPTEGMRELVRVAKPGGFVVVVMREEYLSYVVEYKDRLEPLMKQLELDGVWTKVCRLPVANYSFQKPGVVFAFQKL